MRAADRSLDARLPRRGDLTASLDPLLDAVGTDRGSPMMRWIVSVI
jgi:hypothetical protein